jgi:hypothetical protein
VTHSTAWFDRFGKFGKAHWCVRPYIRRTLGDPPATEAGQLLWLEAVDFIDQAREELGIDHPDHPFGWPRPKASELWRRERQRAIDMTASYCRRLARIIEESRGVA